MLTPNKVVIGAIIWCLASVKLAQGADPDWWKHAVFYQIYPRSFKDSNGDGVGDLQGIISKLDHLKDIGVTAAWLSPIYKSPQVDQGYDISNFTDIHEEYGTLDDFDQLLTKAHELGIKIIMDFVPNHSSDQHEWFINSENSVAGYEDFYVWKDGDPNKYPNNWISLFNERAWTYSTKRNQWYLHQFTEQQPDLNYRSAALLTEMKNVLKFWLDRKIDGFRMDAVPYLIEHEEFLDEPILIQNSTTYQSLNHTYTSDQQGTYNIIYSWRKFIDEYSAQYSTEDPRIFMSEAYTDLGHTLLYYGTDKEDGAHFPFNFFFITDLNKNSKATDFLNTIMKWLGNMPSKRVANWVLGNHDNRRVASRFGPERADGLNMLTAFLPGIMVTYNGEEIGQEDGEVTYAQGQDPSACIAETEDFEKISRDFERTPFQWDNTTSAGFSSSNATWLPVSSKYKETNLAAQKAADISHYKVYKKAVELRKQPTLSNGDFKAEIFNSSVLGCLRTLYNEETYLLFFNIEGTAATFNATSKFTSITSQLKVVLASSNSGKKANDLVDSQAISLNPYECVIFSTGTEQQGSTAAPSNTTSNPNSAGKANVTFAIFVIFFCLALL